MARNGSVRLRLVAASAVLAAGLTPLLQSPAVADAPQETVVPATLRDTYTDAALQSPSTHGSHDAVGAQGVFHSLEGTSGRLWTRYADGESVRVPAAPVGTFAQPTGTDVLAYHHIDGRVDFWDASDGSTRSLQVPDGWGYVTSYDNLTVAFKNVPDENGKIVRVIHLLTPGPDGTTVDRTITGGPAGLVLGLGAAADARTLYLRGSVDGRVGLVAVDRASSEVRGWSGPLPTGYTNTNLGGGHVVVSARDKASVLVFPRDLSAAPVEVALKGVSDGVNAAQDLAVVGDWLVNGTSSTTAQPLTGGEPVTVLPSSEAGTGAGPDGTAVKIGRTGADDWGIQRLTPGADGGPPVVTPVKLLPKPPLAIQGLSLDQGRLVVLEHYGTAVRSARVRTVAPSGTPSFGERGRLTTVVPMADCAADAACAPVRGLADGRIAWLARDGDTNAIEVDGPDAEGVWNRPGLPKDGKITDVSGRYLLYTGPSGQYVYRIGSIDAAPVITRAPGPAALSGNILWTTGTTPGSVTGYDLTAGRTTETLATDAGCTPTELQALGRWLYWTCEGRAGVYDRTAKKSVPVPADEAELGDGYVVTHDEQAGKLTLTTVADGTPSGRVIGDLPDTGVSQRNVRWTVDESGGNAAYVDAQERVHLVPSGVPQQPLSLLDAPRGATEVSPTTEPVLTDVLLSKPASGWTLTVRDKVTGKVVGGTDGGALRGELKVPWSTSITGAAILPNGFYDWTLSLTPADGVGAPLQVKGTVRMVRGTPVFHDYAGPGRKPDGVGDLLTVPRPGTLTYQQGTGKGTFSGQVSGTGWPKDIRVVPIGDLSGDRCNDVLVRLGSGALRLYRTGCGAALSSAAPYTTLGTSGWTQFDVLTSPGDLTKDGRPDLIARNPSTGKVYLYKGTAAGKLSAPVKLYDDWKTYKKIVGVGDLNGDGVGDLIAQDKGNNLYRYLGTGKGTFGARVKLFANWGASYDAVAGAGDITGDGKADLVVRDTAGGLYRLPGTGTGTFGARVKIGAGWQGYKGIF
ncbi:Repeat domain-containing protein [Streptomyces sp. yr375]|uniref:FG-GAP repeat domain-containing protein n=1 Tax=Streptomyces sp. yr375 TaxID=1761906 RepID=UPI0008CE0A5E|nr:VCBS repeat-containing protein [Streptomyces sp. yr375]SES49614.1 Repeat domain-containing protein [Streptomyces sp. yr375]